MSTTWFSSDHHFGHRNIIRFCNRPFSSVEEMGEELIKRHNERVQPDDTWYCLGDFAYLQASRIDNILRRMNGTKHLIKGNHDKKIERTTGFTSIKSYDEIYVDKQFIILSHYGMRVWNRSHHGSIQLFGHSHGKLIGNSQSLDVGVDCWNYYPANLEQILERMKTLPKYTGYQTPNGKSCHNHENEM